MSVHINATDTLSGLAGVLYSTNGAEPYLSYTTSVTISTEGTTTLKYKAYDAVANTSTVTTRLVKIDDTAPSPSDDAPPT